MIYTSEDIKVMNSISLLKSLYSISNATQKELLDMTGFSQSTIRLILIDLLQRDYLIELGVDNSNGGRKATRYSLNHNKIIFAMIWLRQDSLEVIVQDICKNTIFKDNLIIPTDENKISFIKNLVEEYNLSLIHFCVEGIIKGYRFLNDITFTLTEYLIVEKIKCSLDIPLFIENDVRLMAIGYLQKYRADIKNAVYMYVGTNGMGSVLVNDNNIIRGENNYAGEIGLVTYKSKTINQWLMSDIKEEELENLFKYIITLTCYFIDPSTIIIASDIFDKINIDNLNKYCKEQLVNKVDLDFSYDQKDDVYYGMHYLSTFNFFENNLKIKKTNNL